MGLYFKISNSIQSLTTALIKESTAGLDIFQPLMLITQTKGMNNWLIQEIATAKGIAANIQFVQPAQFIVDIYNLVADQRQQSIARNNVDWLIYQALSEPAFALRFPYQRSYFVENNIENDVKKWELAAKTADLFDQYQIYRHQTIQDWNHQQLNEKDEKFRWQYYLWNRIKEISGTYFPDMTEMQTKILQALNNPEKIQKIKKKYPKISLFGISIITSFHIQIIYKLSESEATDFYFYLLNPAPEHLWEYDKNEKDVHFIPKGHEAIIGNPLLTGWGKVLQSTSKLLFQDDEIFNLREDIEFIIPTRHSLLSKIKNDIYNNETCLIQFSEEDLGDKSLHIASTYTIHSEVSALYNYLLQMVERQTLKDCTERDILVIVTDVNKYAPYIKAVFDNAPYRFQYSIADEGIINGDSATSALAALLAVSEHQFTAEILLSLFDFTCIRKRFGIEDLEFLRQAVNEASIRFGIENRRIDDTFLVSWQYGLQKLMYGICFEEEHHFTYKDQSWITMNLADSNFFMQQIVRLTAFVSQLIEHIKDRKEPKSLQGWKSFINKMYYTFIDESDNDQNEDLMAWLQAYHQFDKIDEVIPDKTITYEVYSTRLNTMLQNETSSGKYLNKGITFCSPLPFRSIPFKVIAMLGLNMDTFPRKEKSADFDMIKNAYQLGDRNIKENDKHLFLESLLSAKDHLYLSYIGKSVKDNSHIPPSIIVDELLDYIQSGIDPSTGLNVRDFLIIQHPLQSYSIKYNNKNDSTLVNYFIQKQKKYPIPIAAVTSVKPEENASLHISIKDYSSFAINPIRYYYNKALHIYFNDIDETISDTEVFNMDGLSQSILKSRLLQAKLKGESFYKNVIETIYLKGELPLKNGKELLIHQLDKSIANLQSKFQNISSSTLESHRCNVNLTGAYVIEGNLENIAQQSLFHFTFKPTKEIKSKAFINLYLQFLIGVAGGLINKAYLINPQGAFVIQHVEETEAIRRLEALLPYYRLGNQQLFFFSADYCNSKSKTQAVEEDNFVQSIELLTDNEYFYDSYAKLAVEKGLHIHQQRRFFELKALIIDPLKAFQFIS